MLSTMSKRRDRGSDFEERVYDSVKKRLLETNTRWRGESTRSYAEGNLTSIPEFVIDELSEEFVNSLGRRIIAQINVQPLEPQTRRNLKAQLNDLLTSMKKDLKNTTKSHLDRFFQVY